MSVDECAQIGTTFTKDIEFCASGQSQNSASSLNLRKFSWNRQSYLEELADKTLRKCSSLSSDDEVGGGAIQTAKMDDSSSKAVLIGISARAHACHDSLSPVRYFTKVAPFRNWIMSKISDGGCLMYE